MGKLVKITLIFFSSTLLLILAAVIIIPLFIDLNNYKTEIEVAVQKETGRVLDIEGSLNLSIFPWLGISTGKILLSNAPGFTQHSFAVIGAADIKVKLLPLFSKKIEVNTIVLKDLELHLEKNKQGVNNWDDLTAKEETENQAAKNKTEQTASSATIDQPEKEPATDTLIDMAEIKIGGLEIVNSQVSWNDQQLNQHIIIKDFNLTSSAVIFDEPIAIKIAMLLENSEPAVSGQLSLSTDLVIDAALQKIQLNNFALDSVTKGEVIPGGILDTQLQSEIFLNLTEQTLVLKKLRLDAAKHIHLSGELSVSQFKTNLQYTGSFKIDSFSPKSLMQTLALSAPATADKNVLKKLAMNFNIQGTANSLALDNLIISLDDTKIQGDIRVQQFNNPAITFKLAVDDIDIDRYSVSKPTQKKRPTPSPIIEPQNTANENELIPVDTLRKLNINGDLKIAKLKIAQLKMVGVNLKVQAQQGILKTTHSIAQFYNGRYLGGIKINAKSKIPTISLNEKIINVQLGPLLSDLQPDSKAQLTGQANIAANLITQGNTLPVIKSNLGGSLNFSLKKGAVRGFNIQKIIDIGKLAAAGKELQKSYANEQTLFSIIKGSATIKKGIINNPDFLAESSTVEIKGSGTANLNNAALDYKVVAKIKKGGKNISDRPVAIKVKGTFSNPSFTTDLTAIQSMMTEEEKQKVDKFINKREKDIDKALGEGSGKAVNKLLKSFF